ncbi:uncharacterized protein LY89DRAFT_681669 [Mollisia scopiformis]|uniref:Uncharacterized protein n=1 Tax=Mollisia scopiformis TaxID=149040 RepID=A0A194XLI8_MOLSC|nr:uncharacterized protein LY89DRAFT_681669 [Mollisia scopiformis]KUJ21043.1 hypothetical protein LY89DRAFT_681669 [Mollisia scopiformis]
MLETSLNSQPKCVSQGSTGESCRNLTLYGVPVIEISLSLMDFAPLSPRVVAKDEDKHRRARRRREDDDEMENRGSRRRDRESRRGLATPQGLLALTLHAASQKAGQKRKMRRSKEGSRANQQLHSIPGINTRLPLRLAVMIWRVCGRWKV